MKYGQELIIDLHDANPQKFSRESIRDFCEEMCFDILDVSPEVLHFWDDEGLPEDQKQTDPKKKGTTAIQFLLTSNITIHTLDTLKAVYINVFVCREFDSEGCFHFAREFFEARVAQVKLIDRL